MKTIALCLLSLVTLAGAVEAQCPGGICRAPVGFSAPQQPQAPRSAAAAKRRPVRHAIGRIFGRCR